MYNHAPDEHYHNVGTQKHTTRSVYSSTKKNPKQ